MTETLVLVQGNEPVDVIHTVYNTDVTFKRRNISKCNAVSEYSG